MPHEAVEPILVTEILSRDEQINRWRGDCLRQAGYPEDLIEKLRPRWDVDLHVACELLDHGCSPAMAVAILL